MDATLPAAAEEPARPAWLRTAAAGGMLLWAVGTLGWEGVAQAGAAATMLLALATLPRLRLAADLKAFALLSFCLAAVQALSPFLALAIGAAERLPRSGRWTQALDTLAPVALAAVAGYGVPWRALFGLLGLGWLAEAALALFQFTVRWPFGDLGVLSPLSVARLHENFAPAGEPARTAGLGLFLHRLRFAHCAVAMVGPAAAVVARAAEGRRRLAAAAVVVAAISCTYFAYARAALGAALALCLAGLLLFLPGRKRLWAAAFGLAAAAPMLLSPAWRLRLATMSETLFAGERTISLKVGWELLRRHWLFGVGFGNYEPATVPHRIEGWSATLWTSSHNALVTVWVETGLVGILLYLALHLALAWALWRRARAGSIVAAGALLSLVGFHVLGLVHFTQYHSLVMLTFSLVWGLGLASSGPRAERAGAPSSTP